MIRARVGKATLRPIRNNRSVFGRATSLGYLAGVQTLFGRLLLLPYATS